MSPIKPHETAIPTRVFLKSNYDSTISSIVDFALGRWRCYRNDPRGYWLWIQAFLVAFWLSGAFFCFYMLSRLYLPASFCVDGPPPSRHELALKIASGILGIWIGSYWKLSASFASKWKYCADLFNSISSLSDKSLKQKRYNDLANDLLLQNLWGHRSFCEIFSQHLREAFEYLSTENRELYNEMTNKLLTCKFSEVDAAKVLGIYDGHLVASLKVSSESP